MGKTSDVTVFFFLIKQNKTKFEDELYCSSRLNELQFHTFF